MSNDTVVSLAAPALVSDPLTELVRSGARRLVEAAVRAELEEHLSAFGHEKLPDGRRRVVRNGHLPERKILTGVGEVDVRVPKARSRSGSPEPFRSSVAPPCVRRCASLDAAIPWLYLHGVSTGQMREAVGALVGEKAARGLSANVVSRLKRGWDEEYRQWCRRRLDDEWVSLWAHGIYSALRGEGERLCVLVVIGVNARGEKHFLAIEDGVGPQRPIDALVIGQLGRRQSVLWCSASLGLRWAVTAPRTPRSPLYARVAGTIQVKSAWRTIRAPSGCGPPAAPAGRRRPRSTGHEGRPRQAPEGRNLGLTPNRKSSRVFTPPEARNQPTGENQ